MTDYSALKLEEVKPAYNGMTDDQKAVAINALDVAVFNVLDPDEARFAIMFTTTRDWAWLTNAAIDRTITNFNASGAGAVAITETRRQVAITIRDLLLSPKSVPLNTAARLALVATGLDALIAGNIITAASKTALAALAQTSVKWPLKFGWAGGVITVNDLIACRRPYF